MNDAFNYCTKCGRPSPPQVHYCPACNTPLTAHAVNDPYDTILTTGYVYREAAQRPKRAIVVVGIVLLLGPMFAISLGILLFGLFELLNNPRRFPPGNYLALLIVGVISYVSGTILSRSFLNYRKLRAIQVEAQQAEIVEEDDDLEEGGAWWNESERTEGPPPDDRERPDPSTP